MNTLFINAVPNSHPQSFSAQLLQNIRHLLPENSQELALYQIPLPSLDEKTLNVIYKQNFNEILNKEEQQIAQIRQQLLTQFKQAEQVIIIYPMYNYNIPAKLKDYMDTILVPRETFYYNQQGKMMPLLTGQRRILFIQVSGSIFSSDPDCQKMEFAYHYLDSLFAKLAYQQRQLIRTEGSAIADKKAIQQKVFQQVSHWIAESKD